MQEKEESIKSNVELRDEFEALQSIYGPDFKQLDKVWGKPCFQIKAVSNRTQDSLEDKRLFAVLRFVVNPEKYPSHPPSITVLEYKGISRSTSEKLENELTEMSRQMALLEEVMIFNLVEFCKEFLDQNFIDTALSFHDEYTKRQKEKENEQVKLAKKDAQEKELEKQQIESRLEDAVKQMKTGVVEENAILLPKRFRSNSFDRKFRQVDIDVWWKEKGKERSRYKKEFEEIRVLGQGGFGQVVLAKNDIDGREYAIKKVRIPKEDPSSNRKLIREVQGLSDMFHENIVRYFQAWIEICDDSDQQDLETSDEENGFTNTYSYSYRNYDASFGGADDQWLNNDVDLGFDFVRADSPEHSSKENAKDESKLKEETSVGVDRMLYIQMEYCSGQTLRDVIDSNHFIQHEKEIWRVFRQLLEALSYVHGELGLMHRDLKPTNVFFDGDGNVKLGDFGLVASKTSGISKDTEELKEDNEDKVGKIVSPSNKNKKTKSQKKKKKSRTKMPSHENKLLMEEATVGVGTATYQAPEVMNDGQYDEKCDMFSLGIILFEMLNPPYSTGMERLKTLSKLRTDASSVTGNNIVISLLQRKPSKRPSASEILDQGIVPAAVDVRNKQFRDVLRMIKSSEKTSGPYISVVKALFDQPVRPELFFLYDNQLAAMMMSHSSFNTGEAGKDILLHESETLRCLLHSVKQKLSDVFRIYGFLPLDCDLFMPKSGVSSCQRPFFEVIDSYGTIIELPRTLTRCFARSAANRSWRNVKQYSMDKVYSKPLQNRTALGQHPISRLEAVIHTILPVHREIEKDLLAADVCEETLQCLTKAFKCLGFSPSQLEIRFSDISLQKKYFELCEITDKEQQSLLRERLFNLKRNADNIPLQTWNKLRNSLLPNFSHKQLNSLGRLIYLEDDDLKKDISQCINHWASSADNAIAGQFDLFLQPVEDFTTGLFFRILYTDPTSRKRGCLVEGGRFDDLISLFQIRNKSLTFAFGARINISALLLLVQSHKCFSDTACTHALVTFEAMEDSLTASAQFSVDGPLSATESLRQTCKSLVSMLRTHGFMIETHIISGSENLIEYCKSKKIQFLIQPRFSVGSKISFRLKNCSNRKVHDYTIDSLVEYFVAHVEK